MPQTNYDCWRLANPPELDLPLLECEKCGKESDSSLCDDCADIDWKKRDSLGLSLAEINALEE